MDAFLPPYSRDFLDSVGRPRQHHHPTDGGTIQPIFWQILETFDPDHICEYRPSLRDLEERDPQAFEQIVAWRSRVWPDRAQPTDAEMERVRKGIRSADNSNFAVMPALAQELKARIAPFFFENYIVGPGTWKAGEVPGFPHTRILEIIAETDQAGRIVLPARSLPPAETLWYSATLGTCDVEFETSSQTPVLRHYHSAMDRGPRMHSTSREISFHMLSIATRLRGTPR